MLMVVPPMLHSRNHSHETPARAAVFVLAIALLALSHSMFAQRGGGGLGGPTASPAGSPAGGVVGNRPDGVSEGDGLKAYHHAIAVQATTDQRSAFARVALYTESAGNQLQDFRKSLQDPAPANLPGRVTALDQAMEQARSSNQNFLSSFSSAQKSGLQDATKKLEKSASELDRELKTLDQIVHSDKPETQLASSSAAALEKALASFQSEQLALGREMSILFDPTQGATFSLPRVTNSITVAGQPLSIAESGVVISPSPVSTPQSGSGIFTLRLVADLSDLQQNIVSVLSAKLTRSPRCGERIAVQDATLTPLAPANSLAVVGLHVERWVCAGTPTEVAAGEATLEVKLTPSIDADGLHLASEITRVQADGLLRNLLRSGDLGITLRDQIAASVLDALQKATDIKTTLPPVAQPSATLQKALFQDDGADQMSLVLNGQLQFTEAQSQQFANQLKQRLAAQGPASQ
jgi:hypothetical protein